MPGLHLDLLPETQLVSDFTMAAEDAIPTSGYSAIAFQCFASGWGEGDGELTFTIQIATDKQETNFVDAGFGPVVLQENNGDYTKIIVANINTQAAFVRVRVSTTLGFNTSIEARCVVNFLGPPEDAGCSDACADGTHDCAENDAGESGNSDEEEDDGAPFSPDGLPSSYREDGEEPPIEEEEDGPPEEDDLPTYRGEPNSDCACAIYCDVDKNKVMQDIAANEGVFADKHKQCGQVGTVVRNGGSQEDFPLYTTDFKPFYVIVTLGKDGSRLNGTVNLSVGEHPSKASWYRADPGFSKPYDIPVAWPPALGETFPDSDGNVSIVTECDSALYFVIYPEELGFDGNLSRRNREYKLTATFGDIVCTASMSVEPNANVYTVATGRCSCNVVPDRFDFSLDAMDVVMFPNATPSEQFAWLLLVLSKTLEVSLTSAADHTKPYKITIEPRNTMGLPWPLFMVLPGAFVLPCGKSKTAHIAPSPFALLALYLEAFEMITGHYSPLGLLADATADGKVKDTLIVRINGDYCSEVPCTISLTCDIDRVKEHAATLMSDALNGLRPTVTYALSTHGRGVEAYNDELESRRGNGEAVIELVGISSMIGIKVSLEASFSPLWYPPNCCCVYLSRVSASVVLTLSSPAAHQKKNGRSAIRSEITNWNDIFPSNRDIADIVRDAISDYLGGEFLKDTSWESFPICVSASSNSCEAIADGLTNDFLVSESAADLGSQISGTILTEFESSSMRTGLRIVKHSESGTVESPWQDDQSIEVEFDDDNFATKVLNSGDSSKARRTCCDEALASYTYRTSAGVIGYIPLVEQSSDFMILLREAYDDASFFGDATPVGWGAISTIFTGTPNKRPSGSFGAAKNRVLKNRDFRAILGIENLRLQCCEDRVTHYNGRFISHVGDTPELDEDFDLNWYTPRAAIGGPGTGKTSVDARVEGNCLVIDSVLLFRATGILGFLGNTLGFYNRLPLVWEKIRLRICCDGALDVFYTGTSVPNAVYYLDGREVGEYDMREGGLVAAKAVLHVLGQGNNPNGSARLYANNNLRMINYCPRRRRR